MIRVIIVLCLFIIQGTYGVEISTLKKSLFQPPYPFHYDLHIHLIPGNSSNENVLICCHGYGSNYSIADTIKSYRVTSDHIIGFNFPDYDILMKGFKASKISFGSIQELLPLIYLLKRVVVDAQTSQVSLYGFSAGGGAVINTIAALNSSQYDTYLKQIGVNASDKEKILKAIQKGVVLLDAPLKSMDEIADQHAYSKETQIVAQRYKFHQFRPIDSLAKWNGLNLSVILFFQTPDEALTNRDDSLFIQRLQQYNSRGKTIVLVRNEGGHIAFHRSLWQAYQSLLANSKEN